MDKKQKTIANEMAKLITEKSNEVYKLLISKNIAYGNSANSPANIFSKGNAQDGLCARIDDKLMRIKNAGLNDNTKDTVYDLVGYLILLLIEMDKNE